MQVISGGIYALVEMMAFLAVQKLELNYSNMVYGGFHKWIALAETPIYLILILRTPPKMTLLHENLDSFLIRVT